MSNNPLSPVVSRRTPGDGWEVEFDLEVYERLMELDSDIDKAIAALCSRQWGRA